MTPLRQSETLWDTSETHLRHSTPLRYLSQCEILLRLSETVWNTLSHLWDNTLRHLDTSLCWLWFLRMVLCMRLHISIRGSCQSLRKSLSAATLVRDCLEVCHAALKYTSQVYLSWKLIHTQSSSPFTHTLVVKTTLRVTQPEPLSWSRLGSGNSCPSAFGWPRYLLSRWIGSIKSPSNVEALASKESKSRWMYKCILYMLWHAEYKRCRPSHGTDPLYAQNETQCDDSGPKRRELISRFKLSRIEMRNGENVWLILWNVREASKRSWDVQTLLERFIMRLAARSTLCKLWKELSLPEKKIF